MVAALLALIIGSTAVISTRVAHYEIRKIEIGARAVPPVSAEPLREFFRVHRSWSGVQPLLARMAAEAHADIYLFDSAQRLVAASTRRPGRAELARDGRTLTVAGRRGGARIRERLLGPQVVINDGAGGVAGALFIVPPHLDSAPRTRALDITFFWTFLGAALFGLAMAFALARWVTVPVERLTDAARRMEAGDLAVRVEPRGGAELEELSRGFNSMAAAIARTEELRRRMVGDVAHELRAPLTNIRCELESMQDGLAAPTPERIASLHQETMHLAELVDDLQDLALADAGGLRIEPRPVAVETIARRAVGGMEPRARERGVALVCEGDENMIVLADSRRAIQIITNLLANAITHMPEPGEVRVTWRAVDGEAVVSVIDSGVGIAAEELPRIFERFYRVDVSRSRATGGAGLGLSIVQQLVSAHGGRVWAESTPGKGSTFSFTLPLAGASS